MGTTCTWLSCSIVGFSWWIDSLTDRKQLWSPLSEQDLWLAPWIIWSSEKQKVATMTDGYSLASHHTIVHVFTKSHKTGKDRGHFWKHCQLFNICGRKTLCLTDTGCLFSINDFQCEKWDMMTGNSDQTVMYLDDQYKYCLFLFSLVYIRLAAGCWFSFVFLCQVKECVPVGPYVYGRTVRTQQAVNTCNALTCSLNFTFSHHFLSNSLHRLISLSLSYTNATPKRLAFAATLWQGLVFFSFFFSRHNCGD